MEVNKNSVCVIKVLQKPPMAYEITALHAKAKIADLIFWMPLKTVLFIARVNSGQRCCGILKISENLHVIQILQWNTVTWNDM